VPGHVVGIETHLDQDLREPEVVGCSIENAVQHDGHISFGAGEASLPEVAYRSATNLAARLPRCSDSDVVVCPSYVRFALRGGGKADMPKLVALGPEAVIPATRLIMQAQAWDAQRATKLTDDPRKRGLPGEGTLSG